MTTFRQLLERAELRQVDLARVLTYLSGRPVDQVTVNRWAVGSQAPRPAVIAFLVLWAMLPGKLRRKILETVPPWASRPWK